MKYIDKHAYFRCLELSVSESCNYQCRYCIFWRNNRRRALMSQELALAVTDKYLDYLEYSPSSTLGRENLCCPGRRSTQYPATSGGECLPFA